jgi:hypothetical protein
VLYVVFVEVLILFLNCLCFDSLDLVLKLLGFQIDDVQAGLIFMLSGLLPDGLQVFRPLVHLLLALRAVPHHW